MKYYNYDVVKVMKELDSCNEGLNDKEVFLRQSKYGKNILKEQKKESNFKKFVSKFSDLMIIILLISSVVSFIVSYVNKESYIDSIIIIAIVIVNAILGFVQELKADNALEALKKLQVTKVKVKRNNRVVIIPSSEVVVGDILVLEAGDFVSADARIIWEASLKCDESSLTGESCEVIKTSKVIEGDVAISERSNMVFSGTNVTYGKALAVVTSIGMETEFGLIAKSLLKEEKEVTPLEIKIKGISKFLTLLIFVIVVVMFIVGLIKGMDLISILMLCISLAVAAIPEGLPAVITITLSLGVSSMAKKNAIIRKLSSVETLGSCEVICSDKTGTITQNKMVVKDVFYNDRLWGIDSKLDSDLIKMMILNNDASKSGNSYVGDPTEIAIYKFIEKKDVDILSIKNKYVRIDEVPFDSERKMMSTVNKYRGKIKVITKGSFDSVIKCCSKIYDNGKVCDLDLNKIKELKEKEKELSGMAYRIIAFAYKDIANNYEINSLEDDLIFMGMVCMIDPPRSDVKKSIDLCKSANIRTIMITGDSIDTACAIGKSVGIIDDDSKAITGLELDKMSKKELRKKVNDYNVYARVSPMNKLDIVNALKDNNMVVAMTGDGVNDAPALKSADVGIGMGIEGTEVSKGVSDIILADDSFSTIVSAVREGRRIFDNIRNVLVYLLVGNISEIIIVFIGMLLGKEIFLPVQLLYINLITDSIPAIALSFEEESSDIMKRSVRKKDSSFFTRFLLSKIFISSILKSFGILLVYIIGLKLYGDGVSNSMAFLTIIFFEILFAYSCKNLKKNVFETKIFGNKYLNKSILILIIIQLLVFFTPIRGIFNIASLSWLQVLFCFLITSLVFLIDEFTKNFIVNIFKD